VQDNNPLLALGLPLAFDQIRPAHVGPAIRQLVEEAQARIDAIATLTAPRTYDNMLGALDAST
jgi:oligopeptidase A